MANDVLQKKTASKGSAFHTFSSKFFFGFEKNVSNSPTDFSLLEADLLLFVSVCGISLVFDVFLNCFFLQHRQYALMDESLMRQFLKWGSSSHSSLKPWKYHCLHFFRRRRCSFTHFAGKIYHHQEVRYRCKHGYLDIRFDVVFG